MGGLFSKEEQPWEGALVLECECCTS